MILFFNCNTDTKSKMDSLLKAGVYKDYSDLVSVAVNNLWEMEREFAEKGTVSLEGSLAPPPPPPASSAPKQPPAKTTAPSFVPSSHTAPAPRPASACPPPPCSAIAQAAVPALFAAEGLDALSPSAIEVPEVEGFDKTYTLDHWLFGQYNKLLPAKANCRALLRFAADSPEGPFLEAVAEETSRNAVELGDYLAELDQRHKIGRDEALATAFPRRGADAEKSRLRYANQFVGNLNRQGVPSGLLFEYRLAILVPGKEGRVLPTVPAVEFARLRNPVLDACQTHPAQKFSPEEVAFLLDHIRSRIPAEDFAFRVLLRSIADGANTPDTLAEALQTLATPETERAFSLSFYASQRSSALSRMADLGLIARKRQGVRVAYAITPGGEAFVQEGNANKKEENARS